MCEFLIFDLNQYNFILLDGGWGRGLKPRNHPWFATI
jgi:hypothetical protein